MIATTPATGLSLLVLVGSILILAGTVLAVRQRDHLGALLGFGAVVEAGVACLGWGYGGSAGLVGGTVVVLVQVLARLLAFGALLQLAGYGGRLSLAALRGSGQARPVSAALFGFGLFATIGISPFMVPDGRLLVLHAARGAGGLTVLILSAVSALVMAWLTIRAVQAVCLESRGQRAAPVADRPAPYLWALAGLLALGGVDMHGPFSLAKLPVSFVISATMNCLWAPVMIILHKLSDSHIAATGGSLRRYFATKPDIAGAFAAINWTIMWGFVLKKTIPLFWIPAHTIIFLLPSHLQVLLTALLGVVLGVVLSLAAQSARGGAMHSGVPSQAD